MVWHSIQKDKLATVDGVPMLDHFRKHRITRLGACDPKKEPQRGTLEKHVKKIEDHLWNNRFPVYKQWRFDFYDQYQKRGWFRMKTGFVCQGIIDRNGVVNYPIQGSSFHCLLQSLIWIQKELKQRRLQSIIIGQIHDSIMLDVVPSELDEVLRISKSMMVDRLTEEWDWITIPRFHYELSDSSW
jgi:hypothetical protein